MKPILHQLNIYPPAFLRRKSYRCTYYFTYCLINLLKVWNASLKASNNFTEGWFKWFKIVIFSMFFHSIYLSWWEHMFPWFLSWGIIDFMGLKFRTCFSQLERFFIFFFFLFSVFLFKQHLRLNIIKMENWEHISWEHIFRKGQIIKGIKKKKCTTHNHTNY